MILLLLGGLAAGFGAAAVVRMDLFGSDGNETAIRALVEDFAVAVDQADRTRIVALLCDEEAAALTEGMAGAPSSGTASPAPSASAPAVRTSDILVTGNVASARVARPKLPDVTLYFRKEKGAWTVCAPAGPAPTAVPAPTSTSTSTPSASPGPSKTPSTAP